MYETILEPITLGRLQLKNKVVFAPTTMGLKKEAYFKKLEDIAKGGVSLIIIGDVDAMPSLKPSLYTKKGMADYKELVERIHAQGAKVSAQLHMSDTNWKAMIKYIPAVLTKKITAEQLRVILNKEAKRYINQMPIKKVEKIIAGFGDAALLIEQAGFDMIQMHGDRMCGSFSSALLNERQDIFGGTLENRMKFVLDCIAEVKKAVPNMTMEYKLAVRQTNPCYGKAGFTEQELQDVVWRLEKAGVDCFHVALANHGELSDTIPPKNHPYFSEEGCFLKFCDMVKPYTKRPVCGVGGLTNPDYIEQQCKQGRIDYVAMSRQLIADPNWVRKVERGDVQQIFKCVRCNQKCLGGMKAHKGVHCIYDERK